MSLFYKADQSTSQVEYLHAIYPFLNMSPIYQREGGVWSKDRKQLFVDSIINGFDIPKIYLNKVNYSEIIDGENVNIRYEVIDGKQRLETLEEFLSDSFPLAPDCKFLEDTSVSIGGKYYSELIERFPDIVFRIMRYQFDIIILDHFKEELVDEFFIRLNGGEPLNAQEKRNACTCYLRNRVKHVSKKNKFVNRRLRKRSRYKNDELVAKFFSIGDQYLTLGKLLDTKKMRLDLMYERSKNGELSVDTVNIIESRVSETLDLLYKTFVGQDSLLGSVGNVVVFYLAAYVDPYVWQSDNVRELIKQFEQSRKDILDREVDSLDHASSMLFFQFEKYNSLVQSTNDGSALAWRATCLNFYLRAGGDSEKFLQHMETYSE